MRKDIEIEPLLEPSDELCTYCGDYHEMTHMIEKCPTCGHYEVACNTCTHRVCIGGNCKYKQKQRRLNKEQFNKNGGDCNAKN